MIVQIYEVASRDEAAALSAMGVDHIGVLVGDGAFPREQTIAAAREIFDGVHSGAKCCALSLSGAPDLIREIGMTLEPDILHLGAAPDRLAIEAVQWLKNGLPDLAIMRSIPVIDESSVTLAQAWAAIADFLLLDSYDPGDRQVGALGTTHNWELDRRIVQGVTIPVIIAGGLGPENIAAAIAASYPAGVDSKTRTDKADGSHTKDLAKVQAFVRAARIIPS